MSTAKEFEALVVTPPIHNSAAVKCIAVLIANATTQTVDLGTLFGQFGGHYLTMQADGAKVYVAFSANAQTTIDETATGNNNNCCWPIPDGTQLPVFPGMGARETATNYGTMVSNYNFLQYKVATSVATAYLRLYRSSLEPTQQVDTFKAP